MHTIKFDQHIHSPDWLNTTFRLGSNWAKRLEIGDRVQLVSAKDPEKEPLEAEVTTVLLARLGHIPQVYMNQEHDPVVRNTVGFVKALRDCYPGEEVSWDSVVTVIQYRLV